MIEDHWVGHELPPERFVVEAGRLKLFANVIGETRKEYRCAEEAKVQGYRDIPALPTFLFAAEMESGNLFKLLGQMGVPVTSILHGEQRFDYYDTACAGDVLIVKSKVTDLATKKGGHMQLMHMQTHIARENGQPIQDNTSVIVVRHTHGTDQ